MTVSPVFLLYDSDALLQRMMTEAAAWRISFREEDAMDDVVSPGAAAEAGRIINTMRCPSGHRSLSLNELRSDYPTAGIVVLTEEMVFGPERASLLFAGADACFDASVVPMEVVASLQALWRRGYAFGRVSQDRAKPDIADQLLVCDSNNKRWELKDDGWLLLTPSGREIGLTPTERHLLQVLMANCPNPVERKDLVVKSRPGDIGRYVDVQISRIKQKLIATGERLPIRSLRGYGYVFVGNST